ncbi:MAG TPA: acetylxylan esterase [Terriglobales bacterium]|nr:acetylxylan esterase [Terriglobales bacterium]
MKASIRTRPTVFPAYLAVVTLTVAGSALAQSDARARQEMVCDYLKKTAAGISSQCLSDVRDMADWKVKRPLLRQHLMYMLGLDPLPKRTPLHVRITGTLERPNYRIEKVVFESMPGLYVTGNFYLPHHASGPHPTILYLCGHSPNPAGAKSNYQDRAAWFASNGYCCLILDTLEFGEVPGIHHGIHDLNLWNWLSLGYTPAGTEVWNAIRALDYLDTRPEADKSRIGVTGISGGGAITWYVAAVDERVAAAAPVCSTYAFGSQAAHWVAAGQCDCIYFHNTYLEDFPLVGALIAPRPLLILGGRRDPDFPPDGFHEVFQKAKRIYDLYAPPDAGPERIGLVDDDVGHEDSPLILTEARRWMDQWVKKGAPSRDPETFEREKPEDLAVLSRLPPDAVNYRIQNLLIPTAPLKNWSTAAAWNERRPQLLAELKDKVFRWFPENRTEFETAVNQWNPGWDPGWLASYADYHEVEFTSEPGIRVRARVLSPKGDAGKAPVLLYVKRPGDSIYFFDMDELLPVLGRYKVVIFYPRLTEQPVSAPEFAEIERTASWTGRTVASMQVWDILRAIQWVVAEEKTSSPSIAVYGKEGMGILGLYAALFDEHVKQVILANPPASHWQGPALLNVLRVSDIPEVAAAFAPRRLVFMTEPPKPFDYTRAVYKLLGKPASLVHAGSLPEALQVWNYGSP